MQRILLSILLSACCSLGVQAEETKLPFDRASINRYSLDHLPRSISIRQGKDTWLGYDLERAKLYKAWQAPPGEAGLKASGFVMQSIGKTLYEDKSNNTWRLKLGGETTTLAIRYLGCTQRDDSFELRWELKHDAGAMTLRERIAMVAEEPIARTLQVESLPPGGQLLLPTPMQKAWNLTTAQGETARHLSEPQWYQLSIH